MLCLFSIGHNSTIKHNSTYLSTYDLVKLCAQFGKEVSLSEYTDPEKVMATHSTVLEWIIPWSEEPSRL